MDGLFFTAATFGAILFVVALILFLKRRSPPKPTAPSLRIDVAEIAETLPPSSGPRLEIRRIPVRLAVLVLAPAGRDSRLADHEIASLADAIVPGLASCLNRHNTRVVYWPAQLSSQGFVRSFFANVPLPGQQGKGSIWCSLAGRCEGEKAPFLAGMALSAERPNSLAQLTINSPHEWLDLLRVEGNP